MANATRHRALWLTALVILFTLCAIFLNYSNSAQPMRIATSPQAVSSHVPVAPDTIWPPGDAITTSKTNASCDFPQSPNDGPSTTALEDRPLITYAYHETDFARVNLQFFVDHGLHGAADFIFILNGPTDVDATIIFKQLDDGGVKRTLDNVMIKRRNNDCYDLGAHNEVLQGVVGGDGWFGPHGPIPFQSDRLSSRSNEGRGARQNSQEKRTIQKELGNTELEKETIQRDMNLLQKRTDIVPNHLKPLKDQYKRFILMNGSIRGPFMPPWNTQCWSDAYLGKITAKVKLVGMSYNCHGGQGHVQSMIWATDATGLAVMLTPEGIGFCPNTMSAARVAEVGTTTTLRAHGYEVDAFLSVYHSMDKVTKAARIEKLRAKQDKVNAALNSGIEENHNDRDEDKKTIALESNSNYSSETETEYYDTNTQAAINLAALNAPGDFWKDCKEADWLGPGSYYGTFVHPYENLFMKSHRHIEDTVLDRLTEWHDGSGVNSWEVCH